MRLNKLLVRSFRIVERAEIDTDTLDPEYLQVVSETLERAHATLSPLQITEEGEDSVYLGLGWPEDMRDLNAAPKEQQVLGKVFGEMHSPDGTVFYLHHQGWGPVYVVLPAEQEEEFEEEEEEEVRVTEVGELLSELQSLQSDELAEKVARFDMLWEEVLNSLPAVLQFGPNDWGDEWDEYATYVATAMLLDE